MVSGARDLSPPVEMSFPEGNALHCTESRGFEAMTVGGCQSQKKKYSRDDNLLT